MTSTDQDGTASSSQVMHGTISEPRGRRLQKQQHLLGGDHSPHPSSKKPEPSASARLETKVRTTRPSRLPTLGGRVQSIHQKASHAKSLVKGHRPTRRLTSSSHKPPPLSFDGILESDGTEDHQDHNVVSSTPRAVADHLSKNDGQSQVSESQLEPPQPVPAPSRLNETLAKTEELLFVSFSSSPSVDLTSPSEGLKETSKRHGLLYTAPSIAPSTHGGHLAASKVQGAAQDHFPGISHEGHEYPTAEDSPAWPSLAAAPTEPADINEFQTALDDLKAVLKTALRLAGQAAEQERQERAEALSRLPGSSSKTLVPEQTHVRNQLSYTRVKTKRGEAGSGVDKASSMFQSPVSSSRVLDEVQTGFEGITLQIPPRTDSLRDLPAIPSRLLGLSSSHHGGEQGVLPMPPPKNK